jgi:chromosome segregation ATPase
MQSPVKGLERLREELRLETAKCTEALREIARLRIENGTLEEAKEDLEGELQECKRLMGDDQAEVERLTGAVQHLSNDYEYLQEETAAKDVDLQAIHDEKNRLQAENESLQDALRESDGQLSACNVRCQSLEARAAARDEVLNKQKAEINDMRHSRDAAVKELLDANELLRKQIEWNEELKLELGKLETMSDGYEQTRASNDELRQALDAANNNCAVYMEQVRELKAKLKERSGTEANLDQAIRSLTQEKEQLAKECRDLEDSRRLMAEQVQAEIAACEAAKRHAETVAAGRDFMDRTMHEMQSKHDDMLRQIGQRDKQLAEANIAISDLQAELSAAKERLAQAEAGAERSNSVQEMLLQVETLRAQLSELRTEKRRREMEDAAGVIAPKAVMDRIEENKQVSLLLDLLWGDWDQYVVVLPGVYSPLLFLIMT